jgi:hypothetical protein
MLSKRHVLASLLSLMVILIAVSGCVFDDAIVQTKSDGRVSGIIHGVILNNTDNTPLDSIRVVASINGVVRETTSDSLGYYSISGLPSGHYTVSFYDDGDSYADCYVADIHIPNFQDILPVQSTMQINTEEPYIQSVEQNMNMVPKNASLTGKVFARKRAMESIIAPGATVNLTIISLGTGGTPYNTQYTMQTTEGGLFTFDNLPASNVTIKVEPMTISGYEYEGTTVGGVALASDRTTKLSNIYIAHAPGSPEVIYTNFEYDNLKISDNIIMRFSKEMSSATVTLADTADVAVTTSWQEDKMTLVINPNKNLAYGTDCQLTVEAKSEDAIYDNYSGTFVVTTVDEPQ